MIKSGAQILIEELVAHGVDTIFGYPGGAVLDIYDELYKNSDRINHIITAHEQGAAHAADGYARRSGKVGVVIATSGPGATNLVTGIANAYLDSVPIVAITGNVAVPLLGRDSFQEVDIVGITQPIVKHNFIVRNVDDLEKTIKEAFIIASTGRKGPVLIDIPKSVQRETCEYNGSATTRVKPKVSKNDVSDKILEAVKAIEAAQRPYIYCGGGVNAANAGKEVIELSQKISAPVALSMMGLGSVPASYELNLGMDGMHGTYEAIMARADSDLIIAAGVRFSDRATGNVNAYSKKRTIIHIDIDESEIQKNVDSEINICGDVKDIIQKITSNVKKIENEKWLSKVSDYISDGEKYRNTDGFTPRNVINLVNAYNEPDTVVATDVGQHQMWVMQHYKFEKARTLLTSGGLGTMGYGFGAAIGGCIASGRKKTVLFTGDGSFGMNLNEFVTAVTQGLPIQIVLFNNSVLGMVRQWQSMFYEARFSSTTRTTKTDYAKLADAFGAKGYNATTLEELEEILKTNPAKDGPCLINCIIDKDERVLPMIPAGGSIKDIVLK